MRSKTSLSFLVLFFSALFLSGSTGCGGDGDDLKDKGAKPPDRIKRVSIKRVSTSGLHGTIEYIGRLTAWRKADIACETSGTIEKIAFEKGERVKKGQLLAEINTSTARIRVRQAETAAKIARIRVDKLEHGSRPEEIRTAEAVLNEALAALSQARKHFNRIKDLYESGAASQSEYDNAEAGFDIARAKVESARQQLDLARKGARSEDRRMAHARLEEAEAALALARDYLKKSRLKAPFSGTAVFREVEEGEVMVVPPVKIITRIIDLSHMKISLSVGEKDIHIIDKHASFTFTIDTLPGETFSAETFFRSPAADPATRSFPVELMVKVPDPGMSDGMTARIHLPSGQSRKTIKIPSSWLSEHQGVLGVYIAEDGRAVFRKVALGRYYDQRVEILSGLKEDDPVITNPAGINDGDAVTY